MFGEDFDSTDSPITGDEPIHPLRYQEVRLTEAHDSDGWKVVGYAMNEDHVNVQFQPTTTRLWKSPLHLPGEEVVEPCVLSRYDPRLPNAYSPFEDAIANYNRPQRTMDLELLDECVDELAGVS